MRAATEAMRALAYYAAAMIDHARREPDPAARAEAQRRADLLIPVVKAWCTDLGVVVASTGIQVHGGMGYIEETGAAQHLRDARIAPIYEGTNGIQANDLVGRKLARDRGEAVGRCAPTSAQPRPLSTARFHRSRRDRQALRDGLGRSKPRRVPGRSRTGFRGAGSVPYLQLFGTVCGGWLMARQALAASRRLAGGEEDVAFLAAKIATARFYAEHFLAMAPGYLRRHPRRRHGSRLRPRLLVTGYGKSQVE